MLRGCISTSNNLMNNMIIRVNNESTNGHGRVLQCFASQLHYARPSPSGRFVGRAEPRIVLRGARRRGWRGFRLVRRGRTAIDRVVRRVDIVTGGHGNVRTVASRRRDGQLIDTAVQIGRGYALTERSRRRLPS